MFVPKGNIIISTQGGKTLSFTAFNDLVVKQSLHTLVNTATLKTATSCRLRKSGVPSTESVQLAKQFDAGDKIEIQAGYDTLITEFKGFVKRVNYTTPCEIECEGYSRQLRNAGPFYKQWRNTSIKAVLNELIAGTDITIHADTPDATIDHLTLNGENGLEALEKLKKQGDVLCSFFIDHTQLYCGPKYLALRSQKVKYKLGWNTVKEGDLKYRSKEDQKCYYSVTYRDSKGKEKNFSFGDKGGTVMNVNVGYASSNEVARLKARNMSSNDVYEGYEGNVVGLLLPFCAPGYTGQILDDTYKERESVSIIKSVELRISRRGGRRIASIGPSVSYLQTTKL